MRKYLISLIFVLLSILFLFTGIYGFKPIGHWRPYPIDPSCVLYLPFYKYGAEQQKIWDISGNNNHGVITGAVPYSGNPQRTGVGSTFNRGDFTATNAFFWSSLDLSAYAGTDLGSTPYYIEALDAAGKKATGYIGAVGAGETLGSELITNGDFTAGDVSWVKGTGWTIADQGAGDYEVVATNVGNGVNFYQGPAAPLTVNRLYKSIYTITNYTNGSIRLELQGVTNDNFTTRSSAGTFTEYLTARYANTYYVFMTMVALNNLQLDDISFKRVTDPPATAVHIVSSLNGTTRNWASIESGFNPNTIASWKINSVVPAICIGWYFDDVDDRIVHPSINFGKTHTLLYWIRSFANAKDIIHGGAANNHVAIDGTNLYYNAGATELSQAHGGGVGNSTIIGVVRSGTTIQFFKNGVQVGADKTLDANNDLTLTTLGSYGTPGTFLGGVISENEGFNRALSAQEIKNFYELTRRKYGI